MEKDEKRAEEQSTPQNTDGGEGPLEELPSQVEPRLEELFDEQKEEEGEIEEYNSKLAIFSRHPVQVALGWIFGFLIWFCMAIGVMNSENELLSWLFLIVFAIAMLGRNHIERSGISMRTFMKHFLISLIVFLGVFLLLGWAGVINMN